MFTLFKMMRLMRIHKIAMKIKIFNKSKFMTNNYKKWMFNATIFNLMKFNFLKNIINYICKM